MRTPNIQRLIAIILMLGFARMAVATCASETQTCLETAGAAHNAEVRPSKGADEAEIQKVFFPIIEDASEEESEKDADNWPPAIHLLKASTNLLLIQSAQRRIYMRCCEVWFKDWLAFKQFSILAGKAEICLFLLHALKLPY